MIEVLGKIKLDKKGQTICAFFILVSILLFLNYSRGFITEKNSIVSGISFLVFFVSNVLLVNSRPSNNSRLRKQDEIERESRDQSIRESRQSLKWYQSPLIWLGPIFIAVIGYGVFNVGT